jgi:hypothetical protein
MTDSPQKPPGIPGPAVQWQRKRERTELETYDEYSRVTARIDEKTRVIECKDGIQWIVQRRMSANWRGVSFCRTKRALLRCVREWVPGEHPELEALPDWFPEQELRATTG